MSSIILLKGFKEQNTLSLLLKSDPNLNLNEHIISVKDKLIKALKCILENIGSNRFTYFYHNLKVQVKGKKYNPSVITRKYSLELSDIESQLNGSIKELISIAFGTKTAHFINVKVCSVNHDTFARLIELSQKEFKELNSKLSKAISTNNKPKVKSSKKSTDECLFIDSENETDNETDDGTDDECLFIDSENETDNETDDGTDDECLFID